MFSELVKKYGKERKIDREITSAEGIEILSMDKNGRIKFVKPLCFVKHKVKKRIYEIETRTGRAIKITEDHSLFGLDSSLSLTPLKVKDIKPGDYIAVPRELPILKSEKEKINILEIANKGYVVGELEDIFERKWEFIKKLAK